MTSTQGPLAVDLVGDVLRPGEGLVRDRVSLAGGWIRAEPAGHEVDLTGFRILPGMVDPHGDGFERHVAPRRGAMLDVAEGLVAAEAEIAANGITTAVLAQFWSWEGGLRSPDFAARVLGALPGVRAGVATDLLGQLRFEVAMLDDYTGLPERLSDWGVGYVVFNDHLPHARLAAGRRPPRLTGQALKAGRNPEAHLALMQELHARRDAVPAALDALCAALAGAGVRMGSHDDHDAAGRAAWQARGVTIAEFPETEAAAHAARESGGAVILGAPNVVRGGSHAGHVSARDLIQAGLADALASDYHYPSPRRAALSLADRIGIEAAWDLVSTGPARVLGLADRGRLVPGMRADLVVLDARDRVAMTMAGGRVSYLNGEIAGRLLSVSRAGCG